MTIPTHVVALILYLSLPGPLYGQGSVLPQTLREDARRMKCEPIGDFYERPGRIDPVYVFGYWDRDADEFGEQSAIYWCERSEEAEPYLLVVWFSDAGGGAAFLCPRSVSGQNYPGGLRILRDERLPLTAFLYRDDPRLSGPADGFTNGPVIESRYDGAGERFYCHAGRWLFQQFH